MKNEKAPIFLSGYRWMEAIILRLDGLVFKIPRTFGACHESWREKRLVEEAKRDDFFNKFIPKYRFLGPIIITDFMENVEKEDKLLDEFFVKAFVNQDSWPLAPLSELIENETFLSFVNKYCDHKNYWENVLRNVKIGRSSIHGDFYIKNVLKAGTKLFLIDWTNYRASSSRYFDLIDFFIISDNVSWTTEIFNIFDNQRVKKIIGRDISKEIFIGYCIWKTTKELRELDSYKRLKLDKIRKYQNFLTMLKNFIATNFH